MGQASTIGLDIAKRVFQAHGADAAGHVVFRKRLIPPSLCPDLRPALARAERPNGRCGRCREAKRRGGAAPGV